MKRFTRALLALVPIYLALIGLVLFATVLEENVMAPHQVRWGVTFVPSYAEFLGLDPRAALDATLDDLGARRFRLTIPWNRVEAHRGQFTFDEIEWQLDAIAERGGEAIVTIGRRTPRWPECHDPEWLGGLEEKKQEEALMGLLDAEIRRLQDRGEIVAWQVENEPLLRLFGECPPHGRDLLVREIALVRTLDPSRPVFTTESGELSTWRQTAPLVDGLGISLYRQTYNRFLGNLWYPLTPAFYRRRVEAIRPLTGASGIFISELQGEPWTGKPLPELPLADQLSIMNNETLRENLRFAASTGIEDVYVWGVEWWYWLKTKDVPELWDAAKEAFRSS